MTVKSVRENRLDWIDWMKALGIYLIVLGHFYSVGEKLIYVFHVPLFFVISGFLNKKEADGQVFWKKLWYNLAVPMLIMAILNLIIHSILKLLNGTFEPTDLYWFVRNVLFGMVSGYDALWFVYTLILLKILFQYFPSMRLFYSVTVGMLALAYFYNNIDLSGFPFFLSQPNAVVNICTAFPFFALGVFLRNFKMVLNEWNQMMMLFPTFVCGVLVVIGCYFFNEYVAMYRCDYGNSILLFMLGGIAGSIMIFALSKILGRVINVVAIISQGTIIIVGFHKLLITLTREFFFESYLDIVFAAMIVMLFVPLIILTERYFPLMAGKYRVIKIL